MWYIGMYSVCCLTGLTFDLKASHLPEEDGAEQEDGIEEQQTQTQPTIQPPAVQMNTYHLKTRHGSEEQSKRCLKNIFQTKFQLYNFLGSMGNRKT